MNNLLVDVQAFKPILKESKEKPGVFEVEGVVQRAGAKNQNGRIYDKQLLERETAKYIRDFVKVGNAFGECDHPECFSEGTDVLTAQGWKDFSEVTMEDVFATMNTTTKNLEYQKPSRVINEPYEGMMVAIKGKNINIEVTPNHRILTKDRNGELKYITALELSNMDNTNKVRIPKIASWVGEDYEYFTLPGLSNFSNKRTQQFVDEQSNDLNIKAEDWFEFMGWFFSDGHVNGTISGKVGNKYSVVITQVKEKTSKEIENLLDRLPFSYKKYAGRQYSITDKRLHSYLYQFGNCKTKKLPTWLKNASPRLLNIFLEAFIKGDGRSIDYIRDGKNHNRKSVFSTSKTLIDDIQEILLKVGISGNITKPELKDVYFNESVQDGDVLVQKKRLVKKENKSTLYNLNISPTEDIWLDKRCGLTIEKTWYNGNIYCTTVPNSNVYVRKNGKAHFSGNSSIVSLKNASHVIKDLWWNGGDLMGRIELLNTPSGNIVKEIIKGGHTIGISSRGTGSVKQTNEGTLMVQDDFELVCFDFVSNPSTQGAFMKPSHLNEGKDAYSKYIKLDSILNNILRS